MPMSFQQTKRGAGKYAVTLTAFLLLVQVQAVLAQSEHVIPLATAASDSALQSFIRIINRSNRAGTVRIHAVDDSGRRFGPISLSLDAKETRHFNSVDLERGNPSKGLSGGVGDGAGHWRLELSSELPIEALAYIRTADGFVTNMHEVAAEAQPGSNRYHVPFFNSGRNRNQESKLRLINPGSDRASIEITGVDDGGRAPPLGAVQLTLGAGMARMLTASQLENGSSGLTGRLGAGQGKWRLSVSADRPIRAMSLLQLPTGHLTNLSRGREGVSVGTPPPVDNQPDLVVQSPSVSDSSPNAGQSFTLSATVRNRGTARSAATTLRYYRSSDATISTGDTEVGTDAVSGLAASGTSPESIGLTASSRAGTYHYGACVESVAGESDTGNNCSSAVRVAVSRPTSRSDIELFVTDACHDGENIQYRFFEFEPEPPRRLTGIWPSAGRVYVTAGLNIQHRSYLRCTTGRLVCYGGEPRDSQQGYWGLGIDGDKDCSHCCVTCRSNISSGWRLACGNFDSRSVPSEGLTGEAPKSASIR